MESLSVVSIVFGAILVVLRLPLVIAPERSTRLFRKITATHARIRVLGLLGTILAAAMIYFSYKAERMTAYVIFMFGCITAYGSVFLCFLFPKSYQRVSDFFFESDPFTKRLLSLFVVGLGGLFIYMGIGTFHT